MPKINNNIAQPENQTVVPPDPETPIKLNKAFNKCKNKHAKIKEVPTLWSTRNAQPEDTSQIQIILQKPVFTPVQTYSIPTNIPDTI